MADVLRKGEQWLAAVLKRHAASQISYRRGESEILVDAIFGRTDYDVENAGGIRVAAQMNDFLILAEDFTFDEPEVGDQIVTDGIIYEVMPLADQGHWRWSDAYRTTLRIHAREIGTDG